MATNGKWDQIVAAKGPPGGRAEIAAGGRALGDALRLSELRQQRGLTQAGIAELLNKSQGNVSELERRDDVYLSSLREYVEALGGHLEVAAVFDDDQAIPIGIGPAAGVEHGLTKGRA